MGVGDDHPERQKSKLRGHCLQCPQAGTSTVNREGTSRSFNRLKSKEEHFSGPMEIVLEERQWRKGEASEKRHAQFAHIVFLSSLIHAHLRCF